MLLRLLQSPLIDVLLILLLLRIFFPFLFGIKRRTREKEEKEPIIRQDSSGQQEKFKNDQGGEYIDYEEVK